MNQQLQRRALGRVALTEETVESFYDGSRSGTAEQCLKALCESHERLRMENQGLDLLRNDAEKEVASLKKALRYAADCSTLEMAGPIRNKAMLSTEQPDYVLAFDGGVGTADCVKQAKAMGITVHVVEGRR